MKDPIYVNLIYVKVAGMYTVYWKDLKIVEHITVLEMCTHIYVAR